MKKDRQDLKIKIVDPEKKGLGHLLPVTEAMVQDDEILAKMTKWRNMATKSFLTQFIGPEPRIQAWLKNTVIPDPARMLFLIHTGTRLVGQHGFLDLSGNSAELDNLIRGEMGGIPT
ncbi:MAG: hypothetical protein KKA60_05175 [Proteobacteria bacterium]|nr:hypothetical protein [Pseudomonadota bacterium]